MYSKIQIKQFFPFSSCHDSVLVHRTMLGRDLGLSWHCPVPEHAPVLSCPASPLMQAKMMMTTNYDMVLDATRGLKRRLFD